MKRYMYVSIIFLLVCVIIVSMFLDVLAPYVGDLQVEVFPRHREFQTWGGNTTHLGDDVYACDVCGGMLCVRIYIYIYRVMWLSIVQV
jgi:hypothetical protein